MRTSDMPIVALQGAGFERGRQHGSALRDAINRLIAAQSLQIAGATGAIGAGEAQAAADEKADFLAAQRHRDAIEAWAPDLMQEIIGIADGAGVSVDEVLFLNLTDEYWAYAARKRNAAAANGSRCTSFGASEPETGRVWSGQNMDIGLWLEGFQTLFCIRTSDSAPGAIVFSRPGCIGLCGVNGAQIGIACNALLRLRAGAEGLPVAFVMRQFLAHGAIEDAIAFLTSAPHASGQNYLVSSRDGVRSFEASAGGVCEYAPNDGGARLFHTNHPLASRDFSALAPTAAGLASTHARLASITARLGDAKRRPSLADLKAALAARDDQDFPVSRRGDYRDANIGYTFGSLIYEFAETPRLHIAAGPPCRTEWRAFDVDTLLADPFVVNGMNNNV